MSRNYPKVLRNCKARIARRLAPRNWTDQPRPMFQASNVHYEMGARTGAQSYGGIGAVHVMAQRLGLVQQIDEHLELLKVHLPYHESDHVLNIAYNVMLGGQRLEGYGACRTRSPNSLPRQRLRSTRRCSEPPPRFAVGRSGRFGSRLLQPTGRFSTLRSIATEDGRRRSLSLGPSAALHQAPAA